jgi:hypothetical protein
MERKKFLILGHPRSGTQFMARLFQQFGYDIGHERMRSDGISSWMFAVDGYQMFKDQTLKKTDYTFDYMIMNIRHPLDIISSTYYSENKFHRSLALRRRHIPLDGLNEIEMAVKSVLEWYKLIELQRPMHKICIDKNPEDQLLYFLRRYEGKHVQPVQKNTGKVNARNHPDLTFSFMKENCRQDLLAELENFCLLYEYNLA